MNKYHEVLARIIESGRRQTNNKGDMSKMYRCAPLPFVGQKRNFIREFIKVLDRLPDDAVYVDLFGGSGLLSHVTRHCKPGARVVYNDFDDYRDRLAAIPHTNRLLRELRRELADVPVKARIDGEHRAAVIRLLEEARLRGPVDYITLSASLLFSGKYMTTHETFVRETFYNRLRRADYEPADDYLEGIEVRSCDYRELVAEFGGTPGVVYLVDPPYLSTDVGTYTMSWRLSDYLDVLSVLAGHRFVYFTSGKSGIIELCDWMGRHPGIGNPFNRCERVSMRAPVNFGSSYEDIMLFTA